MSFIFLSFGGAASARHHGLTCAGLHVARMKKVTFRVIGGLFGFAARASQAFRRESRT
ncbi:hypothetical protein [Rhizobium rhizosphaerae]|uniref:hypothetical protein n=1 Tax=Xaviernesmea rhizosphaerae TaxID=1672749 RepID=UPI000A4C973A|nr:hypothetical protein [Xaviernesmea rhizosphaerae]